jgi:hypothetical protein
MQVADEGSWANHLSVDVVGLALEESELLEVPPPHLVQVAFHIVQEGISVHQIPQ